MKVYINEDERYPDYSISNKADYFYLPEGSIEMSEQEYQEALDIIKKYDGLMRRIADRLGRV